jgi:ABC-2 type transport system ATP-binding protein
LRQQASLARASLFGWHIHVLVEDPGAASPLIHATLTAAGLAVEHLKPLPFSLEDAFIALTGSDAPNRRDNGA